MKINLLIRYFLAIILLGIISLQLDNSLPIFHQLTLLSNTEITPPFSDVFYQHAQLPRLVMTVIIGAVFGVVGSLMQQLTQNNLTSPLTLGTSSGAWLALVIVNIWFIDWVADYSALAATLGALIAFSLVIIIAGIRNMTGLPLVVSGMVVNILLGAIATALITLNSQFAQNIFMWGAGDLAQDGWHNVIWLLPRILPILFIFIFAPRILTLLRLGHEGATARGLAVLPSFAFFIILSTWLVAASITVVGVISFIGLLAPNIVRTLGARTAREELIASGLMGVCLLLITDSLAIIIGQWLNTVIPSGVTAAAIGAPALIWFSRKKTRAQDRLSISIIAQTKKLSYITVTAIILLLILGAAFTTFIHIQDKQWSWELPSIYQWALRWPRLLTALFAGVALAIAGVILQRLIYNPLASPDILGVSSGSTFALVLSSLIFGSAVYTSQWSIALLGSLFVMIVLLFLGKREKYAPANLILIGIALTACLEAFIQFFLAKGALSSYKILLWLSGSTYRVTGEQAGYFAIAIVIISAFVLLITRWLTLISISRDFAKAQGLQTELTSIILLITVSVLCALVTSTIGPIAFIGLVAPHMAVLIGAQKVKLQIIISALIGATLMVWADWLGQVFIYPAQIAAGTLVAILGGSYFLCLMIINRRH